MNEAERRLLIFAPGGKDARLARDVLEGAGLRCFVCQTLLQLTEELASGAGAILSMEEVLPPHAMGPLNHYLGTQPAWSDLPILVLTKPGGASSWIEGAYERLGNLTLLERPVRTSTLISTARSALRARQRQYEIRLADQRKDEFLAMLAHELRSPLAPISAAAQLLEYSAGDPERVMRSSDIINRQVNHMATLINDLLDVARVTRGMVELNQEAVDVRQVANEAVEQAAPLMQARRHKLSLHMPDTPAFVLGDRKRLVQVLVNLLNNASKYTPENGRIALRVRLFRRDVVLEVADNGIGMTEELVAQVFDLFTQAKRTSDRSQGGLGLGLALVKNLVSLHGGSIDARSEGLGQGSTFFIRLPCMSGEAEGRPQQVDEGRQAAWRTSEPLRILVVDDNRDSADAIGMILGAMGHEIAIEYEGQRALEHAMVLSPHVCLLDIGMPGIDGYELARRLRQRLGKTAMALIAITGYGQEKDRQAALRAGFNHHFVKPVDLSQLCALLSSIASGR